MAVGGLPGTGRSRCRADDRVAETLSESRVLLRAAGAGRAHPGGPPHAGEAAQDAVELPMVPLALRSRGCGKRVMRDEAPRWSLATRIAFRFLLCYFVLYFVDSLKSFHLW